jgi:hypothetical protein
MIVCERGTLRERTHFGQRGLALDPRVGGDFDIKIEE